MPYDFDKQKRQYVRNGEYVSRRELRSHFERLSNVVKRQAASFAKRFDNSELSADEFNDAMRELLKSAHIVASSFGRGGRGQMQAKDWARVGRKINWQYKYLDKFTRKLSQGTLSTANTANRAKQYVSSIYVSYAESIQETAKETVDEKIQVRLITNSEEGCVECAADEALGWMSPDDMTDIGDRICQDFCKCELEFSDEV